MITKAGSCLLVWFALAACGGNNPQPQQAKSGSPVEKQGAAAVSCQQAIDHAFSITAPKEDPQLLARASKVFVSRCETDRWSAETKDCLAAVKVPDDGDRCEAMLSPEQKRELADHLSRELTDAGVPPEMESGKKAPAKDKAKGAGSATKRGSDPCEGGE